MALMLRLCCSSRFNLNLHRQSYGLDINVKSAQITYIRQNIVDASTSSSLPVHSKICLVANLQTYMSGRPLHCDYQ